MNAPAVNVLIPAYRAAGFVQPVLEAVSGQTYQNFTVLVSVDAADDETFEICAAHAERDRRFTVVKQPVQLGYAGNCNYLLGKADAEFAMLAFHDDILAPRYVEALALALHRAPRAAIAFSDMEVTDTAGKTEHWSFAALDGLSSPLERGSVMLRLHSGWWVPNRGMFRMALARQVNGVKRHSLGEFSADWPWLLHLSLLGDFVRVPETLCFKFYQKNSLSRTWAFSDAQWRAVRASCIREIWQSAIPEADKLALTETSMALSLPRTRQYRWVPAPVRRLLRRVLPASLLRRLTS